MSTATRPHLCMNVIGWGAKIAGFVTVGEVIAKPADDVGAGAWAIDLNLHKLCEAIFRGPQD
eukprot:5560092-Lingulodinium_polyedra.AAC.1